MKEKRRKYNKRGYLFVLPAMAIFLVFVFLPVFQSFLYSFTKWEGIGEKEFIGLGNYIRMFTQDEVFWKTILNNVCWAIGGGIIPVCLGLLEANLLVRGKVKFAQVFQMVFFMPQIVSTIASAIIWKWIYDPNLGAIGSLYKLLDMTGLGPLGNPRTVMVALFVVYVWWITGYSTILFCAAIQGIDEQLYEAVKLEGGGAIAQLRHVTLPGIRSTTTNVIMLMSIWSFQVFDFVYSITKGGPGYSSYVISYYVYYEGFIANHVGYATALSMILTVLLLVFSRTFLFLRERKEDDEYEA